MKKRNNPKIDAMRERSLIIESDRQNLHTPDYYLSEQDYSWDTGEDEEEVTPMADTSKLQTTKTETLPRTYPCLPNIYYDVAVKHIINNKDSIKKKGKITDDKTLIMLLKYALGIIGRETQYGGYTTVSDDVSEFIRGAGAGSVINTIQTLNNDARALFNKGGQTQSLGSAQFTPEAWEEYGLDELVGSYDESFGTFQQVLGSLFRLSKDYNLALKRGIGTKPSVNPIQKGRVDSERAKWNNDNPNETPKKMFSVDGTGNVSLDLAILAHNMGSEKMKKYCTTSNKNYAGPCESPTYTPKKEVGEVTVNQNDWIPGYFPNLSMGHTAIGYVEEVVKNGNKLNCIK
jgi:hypothetical protein